MSGCRHPTLCKGAADRVAALKRTIVVPTLYDMAVCALDTQSSHYYTTVCLQSN